VIKTSPNHNYLLISGLPAVVIQSTHCNLVDKTKFESLKFPASAGDKA